jgi:Putative Flp pilus-assembly TadE/G-like
MQRLTQRDDQGVIAITFVCFMVVMLAMFAFAVDTGIAIAGTRSAQNSADAAALAGALNCARGVAAPAPAPYLQEGQTAPTPPCDTGTNSVTVEVSKTQDYTFGKVVGLDHYDVKRSATAKWGGVGAADTIPLTLSECDFQRITAGGMPTGTQTVYFHSEPMNVTPPFNCNTESSGQNLPGGFGWIGTGGCIAHVTLSTPSDSGNSPPNGCKSQAEWRGMVGQDFLMPIYNKITGNDYQIIGFAEFTFEGFKWNGNNNNGGTLQDKQCPDPVTGADLGTDVTCLQGKFKAVVTHGPGGGFDFDASVVWLDK